MINLEGKLLHGFHIGVKDVKDFLEGNRPYLSEDLFIVGDYDSKREVYVAENPLCFYADKVFIRPSEKKFEILTFSEQSACIRSSDYSFIGHSNFNNNFVNTDGVFIPTKLSEDLNYNLDVRGDLVNFMAVRQIPDGLSLEDLGNFGAIDKLSYDGIEAFNEAFKSQLTQWMIKEGNYHIQYIEDQNKMMNEYDEKNDQDTDSEMRRIFPEHLLKKTLSIDHFFKGFMTGRETQFEKDYSQYEFLKKYSPEFDNEGNLLNQNGDVKNKDRPLSDYVDSKLYFDGAENSILRNYVVKTDESYDYSIFEVPKYSLTDMGVDMMTNFLGCIPEESERCYSIIKFLSDKKQKNDVPLGFSASDMRDFVMWMTNPSKRYLLFF